MLGWELSAIINKNQTVGNYDIFRFTYYQFSPQKPKEPPVLKKASLAVSKAFAEESDVSKNMIVIENKVLVSQQSEEDMPPEAKMRMRNIGRSVEISIY